MIPCGISRKPHYSQVAPVMSAADFSTPPMSTSDPWGVRHEMGLGIPDDLSPMNRDDSAVAAIAPWLLSQDQIPVCMLFWVPWMPLTRNLCSLFHSRRNGRLDLHLYHPAPVSDQRTIPTCAHEVAVMAAKLNYLRPWIVMHIGMERSRSFATSRKRPAGRPFLEMTVGFISVLQLSPTLNSSM